MISFMKRSDEVSRRLIRDGYNAELAAQLPELFIKDFFEKEQECLSEAIIFFVHRVQLGYIKPKEEYGLSFFAEINTLTEHDYDESVYSGFFYNFKYFLTENFFDRIRQLPLKSVLKDGGAYWLDEEDRMNYFKPIVGDISSYADLCGVNPYLGHFKDYFNNDYVFIRIGDLIEMLKEYGFTDDVIFSWNNSEYEPGYENAIKNGNISISYDFIMSLGKPKEPMQRKL